MIYLYHGGGQGVTVKVDGEPDTHARTLREGRLAVVRRFGPVRWEVDPLTPHVHIAHPLRTEG
jgi:hypothetical protein